MLPCSQGHFLFACREEFTPPWLLLAACSNTRALPLLPLLTQAHVLACREELNAAMAAGGVPEIEDALADMQEQMLLAAQLQQAEVQQQRQRGEGERTVRQDRKE